MSDDEVISGLRTLLKYAREQKADWPQVSQFAERIKNPISSDVKYRKNNVNFDGPMAHDIEISFLWDFLTEAYEVIKNDPSKSDIILVTARKIIEKFSNDQFSFSFVGDYYFQSTGHSISQNILSLATLFTIEKPVIQNALNISGDLLYSKIAETIPSYFSWDHFINGETYTYYSANKSYWTSIVDLLLQSGMSFPFRGAKHHVLFSKVLVHAGKLNRFPELANQIKNSDISFWGYQKLCVLRKTDYDAADVPFLNLEQTNGNVTGRSGYTPAWVSLGAFEALLPLKNKTCSGDQKLTSSEVAFARSFIQNNLTKPKESDHFAVRAPSISTRRKTKLCADVNDSGTRNYIFDYDTAGSVLKYGAQESNVYSELSSEVRNILTSGFPTGGQCYVYEYDYYTAYKAKTVFLNNWFQCAVNTVDNQLVRVLESLDPIHNVKPSEENEGIHFCRW
ncbi:MAG: hypothetical protein ACRBBP_10580 [Bdellovibrionales bacterium]